MGDRRRRHGIFFPLLLVAVGVFLFLNNIGRIPGTPWEVVFRLWPLLLIAGGLDGIYRGEGLVGSILFAGVGLIFLLSNLGYLAVSTWDIILRMWPVWIIAIGLDIVIGRRYGWSVLAGSLVGIALVAGVVWLSLLAPLSIQSGQVKDVSQTLNQATQANVDIEPIFGQLSIADGAKSSDLLDGKLRLASGESYQLAYNVQNQTGNLSLKSQGNFSYPYVGTGNQTGWDISLASGTPMDLVAKMVVGQLLLDLNGLTVHSLDSATVIGQMTVTLPAAGDFDGKVSGVIGEIVILVPKDTPLQVQTGTAITALSYPPDYRRDGNLIVSPSVAVSVKKINLNVSQVIGTINIRVLQ
jgi:hypothetical protein